MTTWLDQAIAAGDDEMIAAYLNEQLDPLPPPRIELTTDLDRLWMRWSMLHFAPLPSVDPIRLIACHPC